MNYKENYKQLVKRLLIQAGDRHAYLLGSKTVKDNEYKIAATESTIIMLGELSNTLKLLEGHEEILSEIEESASIINMMQFYRVAFLKLQEEIAAEQASKRE